VLPDDYRGRPKLGWCQHRVWAGQALGDCSD